MGQSREWQDLACFANKFACGPVMVQGCCDA